MDVSGFAIVTGAASGIGKAIALGFVKEGAKGVALIDIDGAALETVKKEIVQDLAPPDCKVLTYVLDTTDESGVERVVEAAYGEFGRLDYLVNCAGIIRFCSGGAAEMSTVDFDRSHDVNLRGVFFFLRAATKIMLGQPLRELSLDKRRKHRGSIVNISSVSGLTGQPGALAYNSSKAGVLGLTRGASEDYAARGIRVNAVCPGYVDTPLTRGLPGIRDELDNLATNLTAIARVGWPEEIADAVLFLSGGRSSFITGATIVVDGGYITR
ncbi:uncharacterized protein Z518_11318 [Rhinocladiella mackenziei CBS 650.93]|uniref:Uncharacterized protein n=1 Tax=Rhinocladiella mackenziei CBS 650.93 TaxID=1442369 RepID=A0A0D2IS76_9EURO|nr:uncharacterized protein Z518_11318 [Rhinocladiella mackenziei CBS 650.93]KIW99579.1 hypothetical protein Z518_11318 [Rhinocladiella mackenziei CBS 650.93]